MIVVTKYKGAIYFDVAYRGAADDIIHINSKRVFNLGHFIGFDLVENRMQSMQVSRKKCPMVENLKG